MPRPIAPLLPETGVPSTEPEKSALRERQFPLLREDEVPLFE